LARTSLRALRGGDAAANASAIRSVLSGESGPRGDAVAAVSGAALWVAGRCASLRDGVGGAWEILRTGRGNDVLDGLIAS
jgi:anthranilate phosphoribosyltransferase